MTVGKWDADAWHRQHAKRHRAPKERKPWMFVAIAAFIVATAGVSATQISGEEKIGICHATPEGYVLIVVDKDSFEHGHHRHNPANYFVPEGVGCDMLPLGVDAPVDDSEPVQDVPDGNDTVAEAPVDNTTVSEPNATAPPNATEAPAPPPFFDGAISQRASQDAETVTLSVTVRNAGNQMLEDVSIASKLPDVQRAWSLGGEDAAACVLDGRYLDCWFGDVDVNDTRVITLSAHIDQMPCGDHAVHTVGLDAAKDDQPRNDASSAGIFARPC